MENSDIQLEANIRGARQMARKLLRNAGVEEIPVSLVKMINYLKTQHELEVLRFPFTDSISGILVKEGEYATIGFNENHPWCRKRFTIAHEIGHFLMGHLCEGEGKKSCAETEAHKFASELLMPLSFFKKESVRDVKILSEKYRVSSEALCYRLMECRMV